MMSYRILHACVNNLRENQIERLGRKALCAFKRLEINEERELESFIVKNPNQLEDGLRVIGHQVQTDKGPIDVLALDKNETLVVIEIKKEEGDTDMLIQALGYYDWVFENRATLGQFYSREKIDIWKTPRIVLVAEDFSQLLVATSRYIRSSIDLRTYVCLETKSGEKGFYFGTKEIPPLKAPPTRPTGIEDHLNYITNKDVKKVCEEVIAKIKGIGEGIELKPTEYYLAFQFKNRNFGLIVTRRDFFYIYKADWSENVRIERMENFTSEWFAKIKDDFVNIGGTLL